MKKQISLIKMLGKSLLTFSFLMAFGTVVFSQTANGWFPYELSVLDTIDEVFAPQFPIDVIEANDFVSINADGHFEVNGKPIRFWGTPISTLDYNVDFSIIAREMRKMGVNMVRFHLMDSKIHFGDGRIFGKQNGTRSLDPVQLDKMDYMISELKKQGIYIYMDLLCDREYTNSDGVQDADSTYKAIKAVNFFDPKLIELQKEYATQLLNHVNPYTGLALKNDPVMAVMEVVNEGWFLFNLRMDQLKPVSEGGFLSHYHYKMLTDLWNDFLLDKYETDEELLKAWKISGTATPIYLNNSDFEMDFDNWEYSIWGTAQGTNDISSTEFHSGSQSFHINITTPSATNYECALKYMGLPFEQGKTYTLKFWAKADNLSVVNVNVGQTVEPYASVANSNFSISGDWTAYSFPFTISQIWENDPHFMFNLGSVNGNLWLDDISITEGSPSGELPDGGSLAEHNVKLYSLNDYYAGGIREREVDQGEFYIKVQTDYYADMINFVKNDIGVRIPVAGSNYLIGIPDTYVQSKTDFIDNHGYWGLESEPNTSMIEHPEFNNAILNLYAGVGVEGKPLTASEFNIELPCEFANEGLFFLAAYSSFQNADLALVHHFGYMQLFDGKLLHTLDNYNRLYDKAMYSTFAYAFRNKLIASAKETVNISFNEADVNGLVFHQGELWKTNAYPNDYPFELMYQHGLRTDLKSGKPYNVADYPAVPTSPYKSDTEEIEWDKTGMFTINTPLMCAMVGKMHNFSNKTVGPVQLISGDKSSGLTILSLDELPISQSQKMVMTFTTQQKNNGQVVENFEFIDKGKAPLMLEAAKISFKLKSSAPKLKVNWLDKYGNASDYYEVFESNGDGTVTININTYDHNGLTFGIEAVSANPKLSLNELFNGNTADIGSELPIGWFTNDVENIDLFYTLNLVDSLQEIALNINAADKWYDWMVPALASNECYIVAKSSTNSDIADTLKFLLNHFDANLIKNGTFDNGMTDWGAWADPSVTQSNSVSNGKFKINLTSNPSGEGWSVNLSQGGINLSAGHYKLEFDASSKVLNTLNLVFQNPKDYSTIIQKNLVVFSLDAEKHFAYEFEFDGSFTNAMSFSLQLGTLTGELTLDNIVLRKQIDYNGEEISYTIATNASPVEGGSANGSGSFKEGEIVKLTANAGNGYEFVNWTLNGEIVSTNAIYEFFANANVTLQANFVKLTSINTNALNRLIKVYPNPVKEALLIKGLSEFESIRIEIYDIVGKQIFSQSASGSDSFQLDMAEYSKGIYNLIIVTDKGTRYSKIVKE